MDRDNSSEFQGSAPRTCPHAAECPGCPLLALTYADQLAHKTGLVGAALTPYAELRELVVNACHAAPETHAYRARAKWVAADGALGLFARGTHRVLDLPGCLVVEPGIARASAALRALLPAQPLLDGVDMAKLGDQLLVTLIGASGAGEAELSALATRLSVSLPELAGIAVTRRDADAVQLLTTGQRCILGQAELRAHMEPDGPFHYVTFGAFVQTHAQTARAIYAELARGCLSLRPAPSAQVVERARVRVLELYAGSGALALSLAARGLAVTAVESYAPACERIARAAREQGLDVQVEQGDAEARVLAHVAAGSRFDVVLLNPPRRGLSPALRTAIRALGAEAVAYVSCRPATLARDLAHFARAGLVAREVQPFDMMPQTDQVESLVWLSPAAAVSGSGAEPRASIRPEITSAGGTWVVLAKSPHESVGPGEDASAASLLSRMGPAFAGYRACFELAADCSGLVLLASAQAPPPRPRRRVFVALVRGVTRARGRVQGMAYTRERVVGGHSLLRVEAESAARLRRALGSIGHPVLGDARADRASAKYFWLRHGLDRAFLHLGELTLEGAALDAAIVAPLAPDLAAVLSSLEAGERPEPET